METMLCTTNWMENPNAINFASICTKVGTTSKPTPTIYVSLANEWKTKVGWGVIIGQKVWKCVNVNNILFKRSLYRVLNSNEMTMKSSCIKACEKYCGEEHA
jgi:hypothetical protein